MPPFSKVLVANRGEIAVRVFRTLRELGNRVRRGVLGGGPGARARAGRRRGVPHRPRSGGGELPARRGARRDRAAGGSRGDSPRVRIPRRERRRLRGSSSDAGLTWIGPPPEAIELMGSKTAARAAMRAAGVPIIPGAVDPVASAGEVVALGDEIGYPLIIKAAAGGGGKGMEIVRGARRRRARVRGCDAARREVLRRRARLRRALHRGSRGTSRSRCSPTVTAT